MWCGVQLKARQEGFSNTNTKGAHAWCTLLHTNCCATHSSNHRRSNVLNVLASFRSMVGNCGVNVNRSGFQNHPVSACNI